MTSQHVADHPVTTAGDPDWWRQAVVYQIYIRSFADSNGDGIGDLFGIVSRVSHLSRLGVDAVWLSPFYPSALADGGYDVDDYRAVDPTLGTLDDFDELVAALHKAGIRLIIDIVPNHTSNRHAWFLEALASPKGSAARARYHFCDGLGPDGAEPPIDWTAAFGGSAWEPAGDGQWYLHSFAPEQPDLNWDHPEVRADFLDTLRFWSDRGVDGFRVDVANGLAKDLSATPLPTRDELYEQRQAADGSHPLWDREELTEIYAEWRAVFDEYDPPRMAVAEAWVAPTRRHRYAKSLGQAFNFDLLRTDFRSTEFRSVIDDNIEYAAATGSSNTWVLSNHDVVRHATRYGLPDDNGNDGAVGREWLLSGGVTPPIDPERGQRRARAAILLLLALPGSTYLYQGEELGLPEVADIPAAARQDPTFLRNRGVHVGRDGCRIPLPWTADTRSFGFGPAANCHLPQPDWWGSFAVGVQDPNADSMLNLYRSALAIRRDMQEAETLTWLDGGPPDVLAFERPGGWICLANFGIAAVDRPSGELVLASGPVGATLPGETTAWLRR